MTLINGKLKTALLIILSLLIVSMAVTGTVAYIVKYSESVENKFVPVFVDSSPVSVSDGVAVKNNGETSAYIRAAVVVNWVLVDGEGNPTKTYHSNAPMEGIDYNISFENGGHWIKGSDGFWYYRLPVAQGSNTVALVREIVRLTNPPEGYSLSLEVISTGIQSTPKEAVEGAWGVTVNGLTIEVN